jgi:ABC-type uncharacterized transport system substrate-binding protein
MNSTRWLVRSLLCLSALLFSSAVSARDIVVGIILDGPSQRRVLPVETIEHEAAALMGNEFNVEFPRTKILHGNWTIEGIRAAIQTQLSDRGIDIVIANGLIASHEIMRIDSLLKPVIATVVADAVLQKLPLSDGSSGKHNLVYLAYDHTVGSDLDGFRSTIPSIHITIFVNQLFIDTLPELFQTTASARERLNIEISLVPVEASLAWRNSALRCLDGCTARGKRNLAV